MANSVREITSYQGNPALGFGAALATGGSPGLPGVYDFKHSWDAVDRLSAYTFQQNRDQWANLQKKVLDLSQQAAADNAVNYGNLLPEDRKVVSEMLLNRNKYFLDNPTAAKYMINADGTDNRAQFEEYQRMTTELDHAIKRGNVRAVQAANVEADMAKQSDPRVYDQYKQWYGSERTKPIGENILLMPPAEAFNLSAHLTQVAKDATQKFGYVKILDNNNLTTERTVVDPEQALAGDIMAIIQKDTRVPVVRDAQQHAVAYNTLLAKYRDESGRIDERKMQDDPNGRPLFDLVRKYNDYIKMLNNSDVSEAGGPSGQKVYQFLGRQSPLTEVDISDGIDEVEYLKLAFVTKLQRQAEEKVVYTGAENFGKNVDLDYKAQMANVGLGWARLNESKRQFDETLEEGKPKEKEMVALGSSIVNVWRNTIGMPQVRNGQVKTTTIDDKGTQFTGYDAGVTKDMMDALGIKLANELKIKSVTQTVGEGGLTTETTSENTIKQIPVVDVIVTPSRTRGGTDPNDNAVTIVYENPATGKRHYVRRSSKQWFDDLNGILGENKRDVAQTAKWRFLQKEVGINDIEWGAVNDYFNVGLKNEGKTSKAPITLSTGNVDPDTLVDGQLYNYNGKVYKWNKAAAKLQPANP